MPILPNPDTLERVAVRPGSSVASYSGAAGPGLAMAGIGADVRRMAEQEQLQLDDLRVNEAITKLRQKELDLTLGEQGYASIKGGDVLARPLVKDYGVQYDTVAAGIGSNLSGRQRAKFDQAAQKGKSQFQAGVMRHSLVETQKAFGEHDKAGISAENDVIANMPDNEMAVSQSKANIKSIVVSAAAREGFHLGTPQGDAVVSSLVQAAVGNANLRAVSSLLAAKKTTAAAAYFEANKAEMTADQIKLAEHQLKPMVAFALAGGIQDKVLGLRAQKKSEVEIEQFIRKEAKGDDDVYKNAQSLLLQHDQAQAIDSRNRVGGIYEKFGRAGANNAAMNSIITSPEYLNLPTAERGTVEEYMRHQVRSTNDHYRALANEQERQKSEDPTTMATVIRTAEDPRFPEMKSSEIWSLESQIGKTNVNRLLGEQSRMKSGAAAFNISSEQIKGAMPAELLKPENRELRYNFEAIVGANVMDWKQQYPGKVPSPQEQRQLIESANAKWYDFKGWNGTVAAYERDEGRSVPEKFYGYVISQAKGSIRGSEEEYVMQKWKTPPADFVAKANASAARQKLPPLRSDQITRLWQKSIMQEIEGTAK